MDYSRNTYYLMRHGEADHIITGTIASETTEKTNPPGLTEKGIAEAEKSAEELADKGISVIYSSPYRRTMETASIVGKRLGLEVIGDDRLKEIDAGTLDGKPIDEYTAFFDNDEEELTKRVGGEESLLDVRDRVKDFLNDINEKHNSETILIVGHAASLMALEAVYNGMDDEGILKIGYKTGEWRRIKN